MNNKMWIGASIHSGDRAFYVPDNYPLDASGCGIDDDGRKYIRVKGVRWYTNLDISQRHEELIPFKRYNSEDYPRYDNYDAIEVGSVSDIPCDYPNVMGVPITFMDKYNPDQFEIIGLTQGWDELHSKRYGQQVQVSKTGKQSKVMKLNDGPAIEVIEAPKDKTYYIVDGHFYIKMYARILIRNKHPEKPKGGKQ